MNIKRNLKGVAGVCLVVMLLISSFSITVSAQGGDPAPQKTDPTLELRLLTGYIEDITPWILDYCDETAPAYSAFLAARQTAWDVCENSGEATQQQIDEALESLRSAYLDLEGTLSCEEEQVEDLQFEFLLSCSYIDMRIFTGIPLPDYITAASYNRMRAAYETISWAANNQSEPEELLGAVRMLQEAIAAIEINHADYTALRAALTYKFDEIAAVSWQYTPNSYERYADTCDRVYKEFGKIPTQEEADEMLGRVEAAKEALVLKGDNDRDGHVSIIDVTNIQKDMARIEILEGDAYDAADVNNDGAVNMQDVILSQKFIAKAIDRFPDASAA